CLRLPFLARFPYTTLFRSQPARASLLQRGEDPACFLSVSDFRVRKTQVEHEIRIVGSRVLDSLLKFANGFVVFSLIQVNPAQSLVGWRKMRIQFQTLPHLLPGPFVTTGHEQPTGQGSVDRQRQWV